MSSYRGSSWPRIKPASLTSPTLAGGSFTTSATWEAQTTYSWVLFLDPLWQSLLFNWFLKIMMFKVVIDIIRLIPTVFATVFVTLILYSYFYLLLFFCLLWLQVNIQLRSSFYFSLFFLAYLWHFKKKTLFSGCPRAYKYTFTANPRPLQITLHVFMSSMNQDQKLTMNWSTRSRPGADYGSDHELLIAKFRLKLKKVGKTSRPFKYDLNKIPYDYTVEVTNRFKGLDLIECLKNYGWRFITLYRRQWSRPSPRKRTGKKQNDCLRSLRRPYK